MLLGDRMKVVFLCSADFLLKLLSGLTLELASSELLLGRSPSVFKIKGEVSNSLLGSPSEFKVLTV
jgi:hypothetical protein